MMYIDINELELSIDPAWKAEAEAATLAARDAPATRSEVINANQRVWKGLKDKLKVLSHNKCWYCESIDARSDNAVDHYRPKGNVKDSVPPHDGYWWRAFDWKNYRFSCTLCNSIRNSETTSGGKQDYFPLRDETKRAKSENEVDYEWPLLLDPTDPEHFKLIAFTEDGTVGPALDSKTDELKSNMAAVSITRYHLDHPMLVELRHIRLNEVSKWVEEADKYLARSITKDDPSASITAKERVRDIAAAISKRAMYSAAVKHLLHGMVSSEAAKMALETLGLRLPPV